MKVRNRRKVLTRLDLFTYINGVDLSLAKCRQLERPGTKETITWLVTVHFPGVFSTVIFLFVD